MRRMMWTGLLGMVMLLTGCAGSGGNGRAVTRLSSAVPGEERNASSPSRASAVVSVYSEKELAVNGKPCRGDELEARLSKLGVSEIRLQSNPECPAKAVAQLVSRLSRSGYTVYIEPPEEVRVRYN